MKMRKIMTSERLQIDNECLSNNLSYMQTAEKYQLSYYDDYSWVQK